MQTTIYSLENGQSIWWTSNTTRHIQWAAGEEERVSLLLCAGTRERFEVPQLSDVEAKKAQEILV